MKESEVRPYEKDDNSYCLLTVKDLKRMLADLPDDYKVKYDSAYGNIRIGEFTIYHDDKEISING
jgi:hypothetical protein